MAHPVTNSITDWKPQNQHVERFLDNAAYTAAHPDDTLLLAGPARLADVDWSAGTDQFGSLLPLGMTQQFQISQNVPVAPMPSIGTGRVFFTRSKSQIGWNMGRLWCNGRNLLRALYHNARTGLPNDTDLLNLPEPVMSGANSNVFFNLESELFAAPMGMAVLFRDKSRSPIGAFYIECMMISSWSLGVAAGSNMIMSNVSGLADRILPLDHAAHLVPLRDTLDNVNAFIDESSAGDAAVVTS